MSTWTRALKFLATGTISLLLTSCYGTIQAMYGVPITFRDAKITTTTASGKPIEGLVVKYDSGGLSGARATSETGEAEFTIDTSATTTIAVSDVDGPAHEGDFADNSFTLNSIAETVVMTPR